MRPTQILLARIIQIILHTNMVRHHNPLLVRQYILLAIIPRVHAFRRICRENEGARADGSGAAEPDVRVGLLDITRSEASAGVDDVEFFDEEWADWGDAGYDEDYPHLSSITFALARNLERDYVVDERSGTYAAHIFRLASWTVPFC